MIIYYKKRDKVFASFPSGEYAKCTLVRDKEGRYLSEGRRYSLEDFELITRKEYEDSIQG